MADHGTFKEYGRGCRCDDCRAAQSAKNRVYQVKNREQIAARKLAARLADPEKIRARNLDYCSLCGQPIDLDLAFPDPGFMTVDHVRPLSKGGEHSYANTALAHYSCNSRKNNKFDESVG